jgi:hypothetical protein
MAPRGLLGLDHAKDAHVRDASDSGRFVAEDEDVERIAIIRQRRRDHAEVERKGHAERQQPRKLDRLDRRIPGIFRAASLGRFDDDPAGRPRCLES